MIIDTNVFVDYLREVEEAKEFLSDNHTLLTSMVVVTEIIAGFSSKDEVKMFDRYLDSINCEVILIDEEISINALKIFKDFYFGKGIGFEDCLIAATALEMEMPLVTLNVKYFRFIEGLDVVKPY